MNCCHHPICFILPPHIENKLAENAKYRERALRSIHFSERQRGIRQVAPSFPLVGLAGTKHRTIYDAKHRTSLPGKQVRDEGDKPTNDPSINEAYDYCGDTYDFYSQVFNRNSVDDHGQKLVSSVHYDVGYDNAFWNGTQMIYGDGDGELFQRFTICIDVVGHELTHGVTQNEAQLVYKDQSGALNESISDVFGSLIKQWVNNQTADQADWLIGKGLFTSAVHGEALRSMKAPGTAYDDPTLGKDPQPDHMDRIVTTDEDDGGVHINSGIPNRAFYLAATNIGGFAWQKAGLIWYRTLTGNLSPTADFQAAADATVAVASALFGLDSHEQKSVVDAWTTVGIRPRAVAPTALVAPPKVRVLRPAAA